MLLGSTSVKIKSCLRGPQFWQAAALADKGLFKVAASQNELSPSASAVRGVKDPRKVVVITGPTAVGKTKVSLEVAKRVGGEIISADSVQVYRGLDVGSDKVRTSSTVSTVVVLD